MTVFVKNKLMHFSKLCERPASELRTLMYRNTKSPSGGGLSYNAGAWAKFGRPEKRLRFSRAAEFGRARMAEPRASGPAALFALRVVFEAAVLIYGDVYDVLKLFAQKARGSRGRDPEEPPLGGDERPRACMPSRTW